MERNDNGDGRKIERVCGFVVEKINQEFVTPTFGFTKSTSIKLFSRFMLLNGRKGKTKRGENVGEMRKIKGGLI